MLKNLRKYARAQTNGNIFQLNFIFFITAIGKLSENSVHITLHALSL